MSCCCCCCFVVVVVVVCCCCCCCSSSCSFSYYCLVVIVIVVTVITIIYCTKHLVTKMDQEMQIHPMALFSIIDNYERKLGTKYSIGILLGNTTVLNGMRTIEVRTSHAINYHLKDEFSVILNWPLAESWADLHKLTYPDDSIVGWFLAGKSIPYFATIAHEYCQRNVSATCVMLFLDLSFQTDNIEVKAYR